MPTTKSYFMRPLTLLVWAVLAASVMMVLASQAQALTYTVTNTNDSGEGSLRQAIIDANTTTGVTDTINFDLGSAATITLTSSDLPTITDGAGLTIDGKSADITVSGGGTVRVFEVARGAKLTLNNLTVTKGKAHCCFGDTGETDDGGGIYNEGTLTVTNTTISGNSSNLGGGIFNYGGTLTVTNSTISGNSAGGGGGIYNTNKVVPNNSTGTATVTNSTISGNSAAPGNDGGGIYNTGTLTVTSSTISGNSAGSSGGVGGGGGIYSRSVPATQVTLTVTNSTISGNSAGTSGGGGIRNQEATATVTNSTISGNSSSNVGGGIGNEGGSLGGTLTVTNSTISGNSAHGGVGGGGIYTLGHGAMLKNTIVANSPAGGNCSGAPPTDGGYNLNSDTSCGFGTSNNSLSGVDPMLSALADNGGPTLTHALLENSPAINRGNNAFAVEPDGNPLNYDQRGEGFARIVGGTVDIGAFEVQGQGSEPPPTGTPENKQACKKGGYKDFGFKNQGQCINAVKQAR